jgi:hypothetical protein
MGTGGRRVKLATHLHVMSILWLRRLYLYFPTLLHVIQTVNLTFVITPFRIHWVFFATLLCFLQRYKKYARKKSWCIRNKHNYKSHKFESYCGKISAKIVKKRLQILRRIFSQWPETNGNSNLCDVNPHIKSPLGDELHRHPLLWRLKLTSHSLLNEHQTLSTRIHKVWNFISTSN